MSANRSNRSPLSIFFKLAVQSPTHCWEVYVVSKILFLHEADESVLFTTGTEDPLCFWSPFTIHVSFDIYILYDPLALLIDYMLCKACLNVTEYSL